MFYESSHTFKKIEMLNNIVCKYYRNVLLNYNKLHTGYFSTMVQMINGIKHMPINNV